MDYQDTFFAAMQHDFDAALRSSDKAFTGPDYYGWWLLARRRVVHEYHCLKALHRFPGAIPNTSHWPPWPDQAWIWAELEHPSFPVDLRDRPACLTVVLVPPWVRALRTDISAHPANYRLHAKHPFLVAHLLVDRITPQYRRRLALDLHERAAARRLLFALLHAYYKPPAGPGFLRAISDAGDYK